MAAMTQKYKLRIMRYAVVVEEADRPYRKALVRRCMLISVGLILAGMGTVVLMVLNLLPVTFLTAFLGLALAGSGGMLALYYCGEI